MCIPNCLKLKFLEKKEYKFPFEEYDCYINEIIDGDTFKITFYLNDDPLTINLRLINCDAPEIHSNNDLEKQAASLVKDKVKRLIEHKYFKCKLIKWDKFGGRIIGDIFLRNKKKLSDYLLEEEIVKLYRGEKKKEWSNEELRKIINKI